MERNIKILILNINGITGYEQSWKMADLKAAIERYRRQEKKKRRKRKDNIVIAPYNIMYADGTRIEEGYILV